MALRASLGLMRNPQTNRPFINGAEPLPGGARRHGPISMAAGVSRKTKIARQQINDDRPAFNDLRVWALSQIWANIRMHSAIDLGDPGAVYCTNIEAAGGVASSGPAREFSNLGK